MQSLKPEWYKPLESPATSMGNWYCTPASAVASKRSIRFLQIGMQPDGQLLLGLHLELQVGEIGGRVRHEAHDSKAFCRPTCRQSPRVQRCVGCLRTGLLFRLDHT